MIIKCSKGGKLELSKTKLTELTGFRVEPYYVLLKDLRKKNFLVRCVRNEYKIYYSLEETGPNSIGCRHFSPATFAKILKAAGIKEKRKPAKKKKGKK